MGVMGAFAFEAMGHGMPQFETGCTLNFTTFWNREPMKEPPLGAYHYTYFSGQVRTFILEFIFK